MPVSRDDITIVLPTLNEEEAIGKIVYELKQFGYHNILIIDGYSTDGTTKVAESNGGHVVFQHSMGKCGAIETAIENVKTPYMLVMDGDCTYDPKDIENFLAHAENYDQIIGVRANGRKNIPKLNRFGNWFITKTFNVLLGTKLSDVCSGMYLINMDRARQLELNTRGFDVEVEIAAQTATKGRVTEVPIAYRERVGFQKLSSWKHGFQILATVWFLARSYNPVFLFSVFSALLMTPAIAILLWIFVEWLTIGSWHTGWAIFATILILIAMQMFTISTTAVLLKRMEQRFAKKLRAS